MENYNRPFDTCSSQCEYPALKARIYFLEKENLKLKDNVSRLMVRCFNNDHAEEKLLRLKLYLEEGVEVDEDER